MTREGAIRWLSKRLEVAKRYAEDSETEWFAEKTTSHTAVAVYDMAISALRERPKWISVKDALPVINDNEPLGEFVKDRGYKFIVSDGEYVWTELFWLKANKFDDESVTHWMPLPELPTKEE